MKTESQTLVRNYFGVDLPEDIANSLEKISSRQAITPKLLVEQAIVRYVEELNTDAAKPAHEPLLEDDPEPRYCIPCGRKRAGKYFARYVKKDGKLWVDSMCRMHRRAYAREYYRNTRKPR